MVEYANPYEAPQEDPAPTPALEDPAYFTVGAVKLVLMSVCTFGVYELYWCYKNWVFIKQRDGSKIRPFWRAFFAPLWGFSLAGSVRTHAEKMNVAHPCRPRSLAWPIFYFPPCGACPILIG